METTQLSHTGRELDEALDIFMEGFKTEALDVTENGSYPLPAGLNGFSEVNVNVQPPLEEIVLNDAGEYTPSEGVYGFSKVTVEDVEPRDGALRLVYETEFSIDETISTLNTIVNLATIETGLTYDSGALFYVVIRCINDTEEDTTINKWHARTQEIGLTDGAYGARSNVSGVNKCDRYKHAIIGAAGVHVTSVDRFLKTFILSAYSNQTYGSVISGDYSLKLYEISHDYVGLGDLF